jgi:hypothetical protein
LARIWLYKVIQFLSNKKKLKNLNFALLIENNTMISRFLTIAAFVSLASSGLAVESLNNTGFELGTFTSGGAFAGGTGQTLTTANHPTNWNYESAGNGNIDKWVTSTQAHGGSRYLYISSNGTTEGGSDDCMRNVETTGTNKTVTGLNGSVTATSYLQVCIWAANGQATTSEFHMELKQYNASGTAITPLVADKPSNGVISGVDLEYVPFVLGANANGWTVTNTATVGGIPWVQYCANFKLNSATRSADIWFSATDLFATAGTQTSSLVLDDASVTIIPEPSTHILGFLGMVGLGAIVWNRKNKASALV